MTCCEWSLPCTATSLGQLLEHSQQCPLQPTRCQSCRQLTWCGSCRYVPMFGETDYDPAHAYQSVPLEEQLAALTAAVQAGKVRHIGVSNETAWGLTTLCSLST